MLHFGNCGLYWRKFDWCGIGYPHRMFYWIDRNGYPRSYIF
jgi:hypothetical protein